MLNINIGLLGHVDSGKTSLAKALSRTASTAAFDKSPQSQSRGITLDLGFSCCEVSTADVDCGGAALSDAGLEKVLCTFVDCPGHASLIRTVVGGAQIIDVMVLVIDATKGVQAQTAECIVLGEVLAKPLVVAINKVDAVQGSNPSERAEALRKLRRRLTATFANTRWPAVEMVEIAAAPRGTSDDGTLTTPVNTSSVLAAALALVDVSRLHAQWERKVDRPLDFLLLVDHCFALKGQGTVLTGTVLGGVLRVGDSVLLPEQQVIKKVKGLQVFRQPVAEVRRGDRVGMCVTQFDPSLMERGVACYAGADDAGAAKSCSPTHVETSPGAMGLASSTLIVEVHRVRFHPLACDSHTKFHISLGHATAMGSMRFFSRPWSPAAESFDPWVESTYVEELGEEAYLSFDTALDGVRRGHPVPLSQGSSAGLVYYAVLLLERPIFVTVGATLLAMRLDVERENFCRIAMAGCVHAIFPPTAEAGVAPLWRTLPIVRMRSRTLVVDRVVDARTCIADGVVSSTVEGGGRDGGVRKSKDAMHAEAHKFVGMKVCFEPTSEGAGAELNYSPPSANPSNAAAAVVEGRVDSTFGKTGKVKLIFTQDIFRMGHGRGGNKDDTKAITDVLVHPGQVTFTLKKFPLSVHASMQQ